MSATGVSRAVRVAWTNPVERDLAATSIWASQTNDRLTAIRVGLPVSYPGKPQSWLHQNLAPGAVWYYWVRAVDASANVSPWFPASATAGWSATVAAGAAQKYAVSFTSVTTVTMLGTAHALATADLLVQVWDAGTPRAAIEPGSVTVHPSTFDVVVVFAVAQSGRIVLMG